MITITIREIDGSISMDSHVNGRSLRDKGASVEVLGMLVVAQMAVASGRWGFVDAERGYESFIDVLSNPYDSGFKAGLASRESGNHG